MSETFYCPIKNSQCAIKPKTSPRIRCFVAIPFREEMLDTRKTIVDILEKYYVQPYLADEDITAGRDVLCKICEEILHSDFSVVEATAINPNVMLEFGMILGRGIPVFILFDKGRSESSQIPSDIAALDRIEYKNQVTLSKKFEKGVQKYIQNLDKAKHELEILMELAKNAAYDADIELADSYLNILYKRLNVEGGGNGRIIDALQIMVSETKKKRNIIDYIRYGVSLVRIYILKGKEKEALSVFDDVMFYVSQMAKNAISNINDVINAELVKSEPETMWIARDIMWLISDGLGFKMKDFRIQKNIETLYAYLWYGLLNAEKPMDWIQEFVGNLESFMEKPPTYSWIQYKLTPWDDYDFRFMLLGWLNSVSLFYTKNKNAASFARNYVQNIRTDFVNVVSGCFTDQDTMEEENFHNK